MILDSRQAYFKKCPPPVRPSTHPPATDKKLQHVNLSLPGTYALVLCNSSAATLHIGALGTVDFSRGFISILAALLDPGA